MFSAQRGNRLSGNILLSLSETTTENLRATLISPPRRPVILLAKEKPGENMNRIGLKLLVVYSEKSGAQIGSKTCRRLRATLGKNFQVMQSVWNIELFKSPKLRALAAKEALEADVVFVATAEGAPLEPEMMAWLELWEKRGRSGGAALVALLKRDSVDAPHIVAETLHQFAKSAKMDFFCHSEVVSRKPELALLHTP
jgi:hypothetical protein